MCLKYNIFNGSDKSKNDIDEQDNIEKIYSIFLFKKSINSLFL